MDEFETSCFDLKNYDALGSLDLCCWSCEIHRRYHILELMNFEPESEELIELIGEIKSKPIRDYPNHDPDNNWLELDLKRQYNRHSVFGTPALSMWQTANDERLSNVWEYCQLWVNQNANHEQTELIYEPVELLYKNLGDDIGGYVNVTIDLTATDEQIMEDFQYWLTEYRKIIGYKSTKKKFTQKDFLDWKKHRLLPYLDLVILAEVENKSIKQATLAWLIWGDEADKIDIVDKLRRTTKPKAERLLTFEIMDAIASQIYGTARNKAMAKKS